MLNAKENKMNKHLKLVTFMLLVCLGALSPYAEADSNGFGKKIDGTYLAIRDDASDILQLSADGGLSAIFSIQTSGGVLSEPFSDSLGTGKRLGNDKLQPRY